MDMEWQRNKRIYSRQSKCNLGIINNNNQRMPNIKSNPSLIKKYSLLLKLRTLIWMIIIAYSYKTTIWNHKTPRNRCTTLKLPPVVKSETNLQYLQCRHLTSMPVVKLSSKENNLSIIALLNKRDTIVSYHHRLRCIMWIDL